MTAGLDPAKLCAMTSTDDTSVVAGFPSDLADSSPEYSETGLEIPDGITYDEWAAIGETLQRMDRSIQWWLGDWYRHGEEHFGEDAPQGLPDDHYALRTIQNAAWVVGQVDWEIRRSDLTYSHHVEVAKSDLARDDKIDLLADAADEGWSVRDLRQAVRARLHGDMGGDGDGDAAYSARTIAAALNKLLPIPAAVVGRVLAESHGATGVDWVEMVTSSCRDRVREEWADKSIDAALLDQGPTLPDMYGAPGGGEDAAELLLGLTGDTDLGDDK